MPWCSKCPGKNEDAPEGRWTGHTAGDHVESMVFRGKKKKEGDGAVAKSKNVQHAAAAAEGQTEVDEEPLKCLHPDV